MYLEIMIQFYLKQQLIPKHKHICIIPSCRLSCLLGWLFEFYGISIFVCYLIPNLFYTSNQF